MRYVFMIILGIAVFMLFSGCATEPARIDAGYPAWYLDPGRVYPENMYLAAVGSGDTRRDAEQQAMAGLAQIFEANIQVDVRAHERYREIVSAEGTFTDQEMELAQTTSIQSVQRLLNVQFGETAVDGRGMVHTIAYLERMSTGGLYMDLIQRNSARIQSFIRQADTSRDPLREFAYLSAAAVVAEGNESLIDQLRIISPGMVRSAVSGYDYNTLLQRRSDAASAMQISLAVTGDFQERVSHVLAQALGREGYSVSNENPVMTVTADFSLIPVELNPEFKSVRWILSLRVTRADGSSVVTYDNQGRTSGITEDAAASFAYQDVRACIETEFIGNLQSYFDKLVLGK